MKLIQVGIFILLLTAAEYGKAQTVKQNTPQQVLESFIGEKADEITFQAIPDDPKHPGQMVFEVESDAGKVVVRGNSVVAQLRGAYTYLKETCNVMITWSGQHVQIPDVWPEFSKTRVVSPYKFILQDNVTAFGYTTSYYKWPEWKRYLDVMALHGYNMMYAPVAMEAIWRKVWKQLGLSDEELSSYFTGPTFFPWLRMGNISEHSGPVPDDFFPQSISLQKKILERMRSLDIIPIAPSFAGFVPKGFETIFEDAEIRRIGGYGVSDPSLILDPFSPYFNKIAKTFIEEWKEEFGRADYFFADAFNEGKPPVSDRSEEVIQEELAQYGNAIYSSITRVKPEATWVMMGWMFLDTEFWTKKRAAAFLSDIPDDKMMILDLYVEANPQWPRLNNFFGKQWMHSIIPNWGGSTQIGGFLTKYGNLIPQMKQDKNRERLVGFGYSAEGTENNEVIYELASDAAWKHKPINLGEWLTGYVKNRYGDANEGLVKAWQLLSEGVYNREVYHPVNTFQSRPDGSSLKAGTAYWNDPYLGEALGLFLDQADQFKNNELFINDLIEIASYHFSSIADDHVEKLKIWVRQKDFEKADIEMQNVKHLVSDIDLILSEHTIHNLDRWVQFARAWGKNKAQKDYYEEDAKRIITYWGGHLSEYSARHWNGLIKSYYLARWIAWYDALKEGEDYNTVEWEKKWVGTPGNYHSGEVKNAIELIRNMWEKYDLQVYCEKHNEVQYHE